MYILKTQSQVGMATQQSLYSLSHLPLSRLSFHKDLKKKSQELERGLDD